MTLVFNHNLEKDRSRMDAAPVAKMNIILLNQIQLSPGFFDNSGVAIECSMGVAQEDGSLIILGKCQRQVQVQFFFCFCCSCFFFIFCYFCY